MNRNKPLVIRAIWDPEAEVWVATSDDVPGLATEAHSMNALVAKLQIMIPELLDANGYEDVDNVPFRVLSVLQATAHRHRQVA